MVITNEMVTGPKIINWIEMPAMIGEEEHVEFLKRDILLQRISGKLDSLRMVDPLEDEESAYFYNLDRILQINNVRRDTLRDFTGELVSTIKKCSGSRSLVHTNIIDPFLSKVFREEGIPYIEKNMEDRMTAYNVTMSLIKPLFVYNNDIIRSYVRVDMLPMRYKAEIIRTDNYAVHAQAVLKDVSMNGLCIILGDKNHLNYFALKDKATIKLYIHHYIIKISLALVTRIDCSKNEIGVNFNINDNNMVGMLDADNITKIIYKWLKDTVKQNNVPS